ncbi:Crp/Fnr family transcriptional regulator [Micromonospora sp. WMMD714]|uniref:Crp/Fnr family transcriptional regulator n=1 Tax=Micromonospora sp. WMMD714 TaxID=3016097 RepID=UPI00249ADCF0|nr:Crp/Fnr family transcriptional regulator [Micromonospora sp. WMMD714]WFE63559.1 Crp/Fnr family transcriptional regulator [Micromonospora sp. WMMD714]
MIQDRTGRAGTWPTGSFLARLTADDQAVLLAAGAPRSWTPGDLLFRQGDAGSSVVLMLRGYVKVLGRKPDGRPMLLAVRVAGDLLGELAILDGEPRSASVVAAARAAGRVMPAATFRSLLRERPSIADAVHRSVTAKLRMANRHRVDVGGDLVLVRIARLIAHLGEVYGRPVPEGTLIDLPLSHTDLAELVAAAEPSVQRALADLRRLGAVTVGYRKVVIRDRQALSTVAATAA